MIESTSNLNVVAFHFALQLDHEDLEFREYYHANTCYDFFCPLSRDTHRRITEIQQCSSFISIASNDRGVRKNLCGRPRLTFDD